MRDRLQNLLKKASLLCLCAAGYAFLLLYTPVSIPCPFHALTGLYCPGCGVSRMSLALLRLDLTAALRANAALCLLLPALALLFLWRGGHYLRTGEWATPRWLSSLLWVMIALLLLFGVLRNLPALSFLAPH